MSAPSKPFGPWHSFWASPPGRTTWKVAVAVLGAALVLAGVALLPLPGPGWLVIIAGFVVLSTEFAWAKRVLDKVRAFVASWTAWVASRPLWVRVLIATGALLLVASAAFAALAFFGVPSWVPFSVPFL